MCECTLARGKVKSLERDDVKSVSLTAEHKGETQWTSIDDQETKVLDNKDSIRQGKD